MRASATRMLRSISGRRGLLREAGDVGEHAIEIQFLLIAGAAYGHLSLAADRQHRHMVELGVVQTGDHVGGAGPAGRKADAEFAGELGVRNGHEGRHLLVPCLDEFDFVGALQRAGYAVDAIAGIAVDARDAPDLEALDQCVGNGACHETDLAGSIPPAARLRLRAHRASAANDMFAGMQCADARCAAYPCRKNYAQMVQVPQTATSARTVRAGDAAR